MTTNTHPSEALLMSYGAGALNEGLSLAVATHLAFCPDCRRAADEIDVMGGALIEEEPAAPLSEEALQSVMARLDEPEAESRPTPTPSADFTQPLDPSIPNPLRDYLGGSFESLRWRRLAPGVRQFTVLPRTAGGGNARLLRIAPKTPLPEHGHGGIELTLVLQGSYSDSLGQFGRGDLVELDEDVVHKPIADPGADCICLIATGAPLRFKGLLGRLLQPLVGI